MFVAVQERVLWLRWAEELRKEMMTGKTPVVTRTVTSIAEETKTAKSTKVLSMLAFGEIAKLVKGLRLFSWGWICRRVCRRSSG